MPPIQYPPKKYGLFYSQPLLGIGQLVRSFNICKSLVKDFEVDFLSGSPHLIPPFQSPFLHLYDLPPLWIKAWSDPPQLEDPNGKLTLQEVFAARKRYLDVFLQNKKYSFFMIELYPFSKWIFEEEIIAIIKHVKAASPQCLIICSARDIAGRKTKDEEKKIVNKINELFDFVFIHADPSVIALEESFSMAPAIANKVIYTGYVADPKEVLSHNERQPHIIVSNGGGAYGEELPRAAALASLFLTNYEFRMFLGPKTHPNVIKDIQEAQQSLNLKNVSINNFHSDFIDQIANSALSISLGGSTIIDALAAHTRSLVYPYAHVEHVQRARKFAQKGAIRMLDKTELHPLVLCGAIEEVLAAPYNPAPIDLSGSIKTAQEILKRIK